MLFHKREIIRMLSAALLATTIATSAAAQSTPPMTIVVGFAPGAGTDMLARALGEHLSRRLNQIVVVENKPGAGGSLAVQSVAKAAPDGNTLLFTPNTLVISPHVQAGVGNIQVDVLQDLEPVTQVTNSTLVIVTRPDLGAKTAQELVDKSAIASGLAFGSAGNGTPQHIAGVLFGASTGAKFIHIPYRGTAPALLDLMGGSLSFAISSLVAAMPYIQSGKLVAVGIPETNRTPLLPDVPTLSEQGVNGANVSGWFGLLAPKGTSQERIQMINSEVKAILEMPEVQKKFLEQGEVPVGSSVKDFGDLLSKEYAMYGKIVKDLNIKNE